MDLVTVVIGLAILLGAGDALVRGAVALSLRLGVPALIVSLTVIAFGTSAPELLIAVDAALADAPGIVFGNVVGSNTANVLLVLGLPAVISTIDTRACDAMRNYAFMLVVSVIFIALCYLGPLQWWHGVILLSLLAWMLSDAYDSAVQARREGRESRGEPDPDLLVEAAERALHVVLVEAEDAIAADLAREDFVGAMRHLAAIRPVVDAFFERVRVNVEDPRLRANRLLLLDRLRRVFERVADFSRIEDRTERTVPA